MEQAEEWRRLRDFYSQMNDGELEVVAAEAYDLTEVARPLLKDEIDRRGLKILLRTDRKKTVIVAPVARVESGIKPARHDLPLVSTFWTREDAQKAKDAMDQAGIQSFWGPDHQENLDAIPASFDEGIDLTVMEEDLTRVQAGLADLFPRKTADEAEEYSFECPKCHSEEIVFHDLEEAAPDGQWSCDACGHRWSDDVAESEA
jgi:DNA-directed RNA polymerase subunit M/transcription elongation factor TFIIS